MKKYFLYMTVLLCLLCTSCAQPQQPQNVPAPSDNGILSEAPDQTESAPDQNTEPPEISADQNPPQADLDSQDADFYSVCTNFSKSEVEQFAKEVKELILASNWAELSKHIAYPITIGGVVYEDSASFVNAPFEAQLLSETIEAIQNKDCTDMFCKYSGIMMGNGEVWISEVLNEDGSSAGLRIIALNVLSH